MFTLRGVRVLCRPWRSHLSHNEMSFCLNTMHWQRYGVLSPNLLWLKRTAGFTHISWNQHCEKDLHVKTVLITTYQLKKFTCGHRRKRVNVPESHLRASCHTVSHTHLSPTTSGRPSPIFNLLPTANYVWQVYPLQPNPPPPLRKHLATFRVAAVRLTNSRDFQQGHLFLQD